jgi:dUTP pyrophosphatase
MISVEFKGQYGDSLQYQTIGSAGVDLFAQAPWVFEGDNKLHNPLVVLEPLQRVMVPTGVFIKKFKEVLLQSFDGSPVRLMPYLQVVPRSGLAKKHGISIVNSPGIIDCTYEGEICVILINLGQERVTLKLGDRIAQFVAGYTFEIGGVSTKDAVRGAGGFGSTQV